MSAAETADIDRSPTHLSSGLAVVAAAVTTATAGPFSIPGLVGCVAGVAVLAAGLATGRRRLVRLAGVALVGGVLAAGLVDAPVLATLVGLAGALLAVDFGTTAVDMGAQLGRETQTGRVELLHATTSTLVGAGFVSAGFAVNEFVTGGQPLSAVFGLVLTVVVLLAALRRAEPVR